MRLARLGFVVSFAVLGLSNAALGRINVGGRITGEAGDNRLFPTIGIPLSCSVTGCEGSNNGSFDEVLAVDLALDGEAIWGQAATTVHVNAHAEAGDLGLSIVAGAAAGADKAFASFAVPSLHTSWQDEDVLSTPTVAFTNNIRVHSRLFLDGSAAGEGGVSARLLISDKSTFPALPPAPYPGGEWGSLLEHPSAGQHILEVIPGGIRMTNILRNGVGSTVGFEMILGDGGNTDGSGSILTAKAGSAFLNANVSGRLRWGGIEMVTDEFGNLIDDWTIVSESGFDYSKPFGVPEPSSILLLVGAAMCAVQTLTRRWR